MPSEQLFFYMGISKDTRSSLQKPGFLNTAENISLEIEGQQTLRPSFVKINPSAFGSIHSVKSWRSLILAGDGANLRASYASGSFNTIGSLFASTAWQFKVYKNFMAATEGVNFLLIDENGNAYPAQVNNPAIGPSGSAGPAGNPNGVYRLYVSYFITWPNGHTYETGLSPMGSDVTVTNQKIEWSGIPNSSYVSTYGTAPTIYRNLYRGPGSTGTLTQIYYVTTITNNTTTTYEDNFSDASLQTSFVCAVNAYDVPIVPKYLEWFYGRLFMLDPVNINRLYFSEVAQGNTGEANEQLMPLATISTAWDDIRVPGFNDFEPQGLISWGSYLYIPIKQTWIRKQGDDPTTWAYRKTYASHGIGAPWTVDICSMGILGLTSPEFDEVGISLFNGSYTKLIASPRLDELLKTDLNLSQITNCRGRVAGSYYFLLYPSNDSTGVPDRFLALDIRRYPDIRIAQWTDLNGECLDVDTENNKFFIGGSDGYLRQKSSGQESMDVTIETHDLIGGDPKIANDVKTWKEFKYALDSANQDITLQVYIDDVLMQWPDGTTSKTISGSSAITQFLRSLPANWQGYRLRLLITGTALTNFTIYSPWKIDFEVKA